MTKFNSLRKGVLGNQSVSPFNATPAGQSPVGTTPAVKSPSTKARKSLSPLKSSSHAAAASRLHGPTYGTGKKFRVELAVPSLKVAASLLPSFPRYGILLSLQRGRQLSKPYLLRPPKQQRDSPETIAIELKLTATINADPDLPYL